MKEAKLACWCVKRTLCKQQPEHTDLNIPSDQWLKAAPRPQRCGDDFFSPWLTSIIVLHFLNYCILKRDNEQQSFFTHEISANVPLLFKNSRTTILLTQNITSGVLTGYIWENTGKNICSNTRKAQELMLSQMGLKHTLHGKKRDGQHS